MNRYSQTQDTLSPFEQLQNSERVHTAYFSQALSTSPAAEFPSPRSGHAMVYCRHLHSVFLCGGLGFGSNVKNDMWRFDVASERWSRVQVRGPVPHPCFGAGHVLMRDDRRWFFYGGLGQVEKHLSSVRVFDIDTSTWSRPPQLANMLRRLWGHSVSSVLLKDKTEALVIIGGMEHDSVNDKVYIIAGDSLTLLEQRDARESIIRTLPSHVRHYFKLRRRHGACTYRDVFILITAGRNRDAFFNDMWCYNVLLDEWIPVTQMATPSEMANYFDAPESSTCGDAIRRSYVSHISDRHNVGVDMNLQALSSMCPRTGPSVVLHGNYVYITGGFYWSFHGSCNFNDMHVYDIKTHTWSNVVVPHASPPVEDSARRSPPKNATLDLKRMTSVRDVLACLEHAGECGTDVPQPFTMASMVPLPADCKGSCRGVGPSAVGSRWLLVGGRLGDLPTGAQYRVRIFEPRRPLSWMAASWLSSNPLRSEDTTRLTARCSSMVRDAGRYKFATILPITLPQHDPMFGDILPIVSEDTEDVVTTSQPGTPSSNTVSLDDWDDVGSDDLLGSEEEEGEA